MAPVYDPRPFAAFEVETGALLLGPFAENAEAVTAAAVRMRENPQGPQLIVKRCRITPEDWPVRLPKLIEVSYTERTRPWTGDVEILVDGEPFPFLVLPTSPRMGDTPSGLPCLTVTLPADEVRMTMRSRTPFHPQAEGDGADG